MIRENPETDSIQTDEDDQPCNGKKLRYKLYDMSSKFETASVSI